MADAFYWLQSGPQVYHHMRRGTSPEREIGHCWIGYTLGTYLAKHGERTEGVETEVLIIAWRSEEQRQYFMRTPSRPGVTWEIGFEQPLRQSGRLVSSERWSFTEHFFEGPREVAGHPREERKSWCSRLRNRVGLSGR